MKKYLILLLLLISTTLFSQNVDFDKLDSYFEKTAKDWGIPGMSVGIVKDGQIVFSKGYGLLEIGKKEKPDGNTLYAIASNTKAFTSAMISSVNMIPDEKLGVVVLTNGMNAPTIAVTYYALDAFLGVKEKDWSAQMLEARQKQNNADTRISSRKEKRVKGTSPSLSLNKYAGIYRADIYGKIEVKLENEKLRIYFEHTPDLSATLEHWHYDVWKINWDQTHAWFNFGTVKFNMSNNLEITGMDFDVPNNDIFFEELKPARVN